MIIERRLIKLTLVWQLSLLIVIVLALAMPDTVIAMSGNHIDEDAWRLFLEHADGWFMGITIALVLLIPLVLAFVLSKLHGRRIQALINCAEALGKGDLSARYVHSTPGVLSRLGRALNSMAKELNCLVEELENRTNALEKSEQRYALAMQGANDGLWDWDLETKQAYFSRRCTELLGVSDDEHHDCISFWFRRIHHEDFHRTKADLRSHLDAHSELFENEHRLRQKDGSYRWVLARGVAVRNTQGKPCRMSGSLTDITKRKMAEDALFREKELAQVTLASISDAVITTGASGAVTYLNSEAQKLTGWDHLQVCGKPLDEIFKIEDSATRDPVEGPLQQVLVDGKIISLSQTNVLIGANNREYTIEYTASPIRDRDELIVGAVLVFRDVSQSRAMAQEILWQATHDSLTGLINRSQFEHRLKQAIYNAKRYHEHHAMCYLDLDQFKIVNDSCGHAAGDELLRQISALLKDRLRKSDTLARLGGDEFGILLKHCSISQAVYIANEFREIVQEFRFFWDDKPFVIGVSIGVVPVTHATQDLKDVLRAVDTACYAAKDQGRNRVYIHRDDDNHSMQRQGEMHWALQIHQALEEKRFQLYCQPITGLGKNDTQSSHLEILLRLKDRQGNIVHPGAFIAAAERYDLMITIDRWVVKETFKRFKSLAKKPSGQRLVICAINLSGKSLGDNNFLKYIHRQLHKYEIPPQRICFEITETAAIANMPTAVAFIRELKKIGCQFALDDFGSGLSSFAYLKNLPVDYLKIDGTFVKDLNNDPIDQAMVQAINSIGHLMGLKTIAEYVEAPVIMKHLRALGVDYAQGNAIAEPMPIDRFVSNKKLSAA